MSRVFLDMAVPLGGFISGPDGEDGGLHNWYFAPDAAENIKAELLTRIGAIIMGHAAFGSAPAASIPSTTFRISSSRTRRCPLWNAAARASTSSRTASTAC